MDAISCLAPVIAPLALKLIDKYIFDDQRPSVPQIIQIPAQSQCSCRCGQQFTTGYNSNNRTYSTCTSKSCTLGQESTKMNHLSARSNVRSSSTSDAYEKEKSGVLIRARSAQRLCDRSDKSDKYANDANTLAVLACRMKKEISSRNYNSKPSSQCSQSRSIGQSSLSKCRPISQKSASGRLVQESNASKSRKSDRESDGSRVRKTG